MKIERADRFRIDRSFKRVAATSLPSAEIKCGFRIRMGTSFGGFFSNPLKFPDSLERQEFLRDFWWSFDRRLGKSP